MYPLINSIYVYLFPWLFSFFVRVSLSLGTLLLCLGFPKVPFTEGICVEENFTGDLSSMADMKSTARGGQNPQLNVNDKSSFIHPATGISQFFIPSFLPSLLLPFLSCFLALFPPPGFRVSPSFLSPPPFSYTQEFLCSSDARYFIDLCISLWHILICPQTFQLRGALI